MLSWVDHEKTFYNPGARYEPSEDSDLNLRYMHMSEATISDATAHFV